MLLNHQDNAQKWIDAGLAVRGEKGQGKDLRSLSFSHAASKGFVYLTGEGANSMDRGAIRNFIRPLELKAKWK